MMEPFWLVVVQSCYEITVAASRLSTDDRLDLYFREKFYWLFFVVGASSSFVTIRMSLTFLCLL